MTIVFGLISLILLLWIASRTFDRLEARSEIDALESALSELDDQVGKLSFRKHFDPQLNIDKAREYLDISRDSFEDGSYAISARSARVGLKYTDAIWDASLS